MKRFALGLAASLALLPSAAQAGDPRAIQVDLDIGPVIGGQDLITSLRTTESSSLGLVFLTFDGTPTVVPGVLWPAFSVDVGSAVLLQVATNPTGQIYLNLPTLPGDFGPAGTGLTFFVQAVMLTQTGQRIASDREAVEVEPLPPAPGYFTDVSAARLPAGFDDIEGFLCTSGDFDRDGIPDLALTGAVASQGTEFLAIWSNDGSGQFTDVTSTVIPGFPQGSPVGFVRAVDLNQDNLVDLVVSGGDDGTDVPDTAWVDDGSGTFVQDTAFPGGSFTTAGLTPGDFDNDGRLDLIRIQVESSHNPGVFPSDALLLNTAGGWVESAAFAANPWNDTTDDVSAYAAGDVDNDGDLDLFAARFGLDNRLLRNDGGGVFTDVTASDVVPSTGGTGTKTDDSFDAVLADFDMDGWLDCIVLNTYFSFTPADSGDLYYNDGTGQLIENNNSGAESDLPDDGFRISVDVADLDADGDLDVYFGGHDLFAGTNQVLLINQGGAQVGPLGDLERESWFDPPPFITSDTELFDMDADGDLEVLQIAAGVVSGAQFNAFRVHLFENTRL